MIVRSRVGSLVCTHCGGPCPQQFRVCDDCTHPDHAKRRMAGKRDRAAERARAVAAVEMSEQSRRVDVAIRELERHASRALKLAVDADAGVTPISRKRVLRVEENERPHAAATAGARTETNGGRPDE